MAKHSFREILPPSLLEKAISLEKQGINEFVWTWRDALSVINILTGNRILVLGGDVYFPEQDRFRPTYDNWDVNRNGLIPTDTDLQHAQALSSNFIEAYVKKNGENFYFSIVANFQV
jgi:hypothetical protein